MVLLLRTARTYCEGAGAALTDRGAAEKKNWRKYASEYQKQIQQRGFRQDIPLFYEDGFTPAE